MPTAITVAAHGMAKSILSKNMHVKVAMAKCNSTTPTAYPCFRGRCILVKYAMIGPVEMTSIMDTGNLKASAKRDVALVKITVE